jgi:hypothetical protein
MTLNNVSGGSVNPFANVIDAGVGADGFNQAFGGGDNALGLFDDEFEGGAKSEIALFEQVQCARMAVDGGGYPPVGVELMGDELHLAPLTERLLQWIRARDDGRWCSGARDGRGQFQLGFSDEMVFAELAGRTMARAFSDSVGSCVFRRVCFGAASVWRHDSGRAPSAASAAGVWTGSEPDRSVSTVIIIGSPRFSKDSMAALRAGKSSKVNLVSLTAGSASSDGRAGCCTFDDLVFGRHGGQGLLGNTFGQQSATFGLSSGLSVNLSTSRGGSARGNSLGFGIAIGQTSFDINC